MSIFNEFEVMGLTVTGTAEANPMMKAMRITEGSFIDALCTELRYKWSIYSLSAGRYLYVYKALPVISTLRYFRVVKAIIAAV